MTRLVMAPWQQVPPPAKPTPKASGDGRRLDRNTWGGGTTMSGVSLFPTVCKPISNQVNFGNVKDTCLCYILRSKLVELLDFNFINLPQNLKVLKGFSRFGQEHNHQAGWLIFFFLPEYRICWFTQQSTQNTNSDLLIMGMTIHFVCTSPTETQGRSKFSETPTKHWNQPSLRKTCLHFLSVFVFFW